MNVSTNETKKPLLVIVSGPSGAGKSSLMYSIMDNFVISFTTRDIRLEAGEEEGKDYFYISKEKYFELEANDGLFEKSTYDGNYYGITEEEFRTKMSRGTAAFISNLDGMKQTKELYDNCITVYIYTDKESIRKQLEGRPGSTPAFVKKRMSTYETEIAQRIHYDYVVQNTYGKFEETAEIIKAIIKARA